VIFFENFLFYSTACADLQTIFRSAGGAFYSVQIRCQAPRRSFVSNPFRDRTAAADNLPERFTTPERESVNP
ncbi:hypothetical protein, partial [Pseudomonas aeruginosa]|uniref:hypothetical protein n=1 Tax=Pseudomonas aeruginosa TaxID=287 RepID=UPI001BB05E2B